jgi:hypothetical protein
MPTLDPNSSMCPSSSSKINNGATNDNRMNGDESGTSVAAGTLSRRPRVAVIGCGPGGMFFLHHLSERRRKLEEAGDVEGLEKLPIVTVMERSWGPGGVWCPRNPNCDSGDVGANMYEGLWINANKELFEFYDYTFDEHFGRATPGFIPRKHVLEYMMGRITKHNPFILDDVEFGTSVESVEWNEESQEFFVTASSTRTASCSPKDSTSREGRASETSNVIYHNEEKKLDDFNGDDQGFSSQDDLGREVGVHRNSSTVLSQRRTFDKVLWAAGENGSPRMIEDDAMKSLQDHFSGKVIHSSQIDQALDTPTEQYDPISNRRILLIGDSYSAEDLALQLVKLGASKVYISSRKGNGIAVSMGWWPTNENCKDAHNVEIMWYTTIKGGDANNNKRVWFDRTVKGGALNRTRVDDIDLIVLCTGYEANVGMMPDSLTGYWDADSDSDNSDDDSETSERKLTMPKGWKMKPSILDELLGHIKPSKRLDFSNYHISDCFRVMSVKNPNAMFLLAESEIPLLEVDVKCHMCVNYVVEPEKYLPTPGELLADQEQFFLDSMDHYEVRYYVDPNFRAAVDQIPTNTWMHQTNSRKYCQWEKEYALFCFFVLARYMADSDYPLEIATYVGDGHSAGDKESVPRLTSIGDYELNDTGKLMLEMSCASSFSRYELGKYPKNERHWRTFRDTPYNYTSIFTGTKSVPLPGKWMDLDDEGQMKSSV